MTPTRAAAFPAPSDLSDDQLLAKLLELQQRTRVMLMQYQIRNGSFSVMARQARKSISNTEVLSELFELFINLQEFASVAKQRKVLDEASMTRSGEQSSTGAAATSRRHRGGADDPEKAAVPENRPAPAAPSEPDDTVRGDEIDAKVSDDFFRNLDK
ncbi:hypothetical protein [Nisaea sediminum]|uniref:hypothetical protein n=1 Tax=Nisaea sediminum TaxID=2775867 RepID=UPI001867DD1B|nr:hypothetical protein [Nisaea sediminum]